MVKLVVSNPNQITTLEEQLVRANIDFGMFLDMGHYGITPPYLVVDGVPLDMGRATKWIKERMEE